MVTTSKQQFIRFLKDNHAYEQYMFNFNKGEKAYPKNQLFSKVGPVNFICRAFTWNKTIEGWQYWNTLNKRWIIEGWHYTL